jgi:hypothetical protein
MCVPFPFVSPFLSLCSLSFRVTDDRPVRSGDPRSGPRRAPATDPAGTDPHGPGVTEVEQDQTGGLAESPPWNSESARRNHMTSDGEPIREGAASVAAPQVPADASVDPTDARKRSTVFGAGPAALCQLKDSTIRRGQGPFRPDVDGHGADAVRGVHRSQRPRRRRRKDRPEHGKKSANAEFERFFGPTRVR